MSTDDFSFPFGKEQSLSVVRGVEEIIAAHNQKATRQANTEIIKQGLLNEDDDLAVTEVSVSTVPSGKLPPQGLDTLPLWEDSPFKAGMFLSTLLRPLAGSEKYTDKERVTGEQPTN